VRFVGKAYDAVLYGMAVFAGVLMATMMAMITADVVLRNLGTQGSAHFFTFTEYFLLLIPLFGAPWLVREKGHIYIEVLTGTLRPAARRALMLAVVVLCVAVCAVLAWYGGAITLQNFLQNEKDVRSFDMPRWILMAAMPLSFGMMASEFVRLLLRGESPYAGDAVAAARE
jgi:TRAP-type C4-dicarboxylate transport system permease small subunit